MVRLRKNRKVIFAMILIGGAIGSCAMVALGRGIKGSAHDFTSYSWWPSDFLCLTCHSARSTFNHELSTATYTVSNSLTLDATDLGQPGGTSAKCLSCHDGTVPLDSFGGHEGRAYMTGPAVLGTDLRNHHPVSFTYNAALAAIDGRLHNPATTPSGLGGTIARDMLSDESKIECDTCHDQHGNSGHSSFLVKPVEGASLCNTCHGGQSTADGHHIPGRGSPWGNCTICHGDDLTGDQGPSCMACHNDFVSPFPPAPGHHMPDRDLPLLPRRCTLCHGVELEGGMGPSCFACHGQVWPDPDLAPLAEANSSYAAEAVAPTRFVDSDSVDADEVDDPVVTDMAVRIAEDVRIDEDVRIAEDTELPKDDAWKVEITYLLASFTVSFEKLYEEVLLVETTHPGGEVGFGIGVELSGVIFWIDASGAIFFGNINRTAATMRGVVFDYNGAGSIWFAEPL